MKGKNISAISKLVVIIIAIVIVVAGVGVGAYLLMATPREPIVVATWGGSFAEVTTKIGEDFKAQHNRPVVLELHGGPSAVVISKIKSTWPTVKIDVVMVAPAVAVQLYKEGYLAELSEANLPVLKDIPDPLKLKVDGKVIAAPLYYISYGIVWRTDIIKKPIRSYEDLYDPSLKGLIAVPHPSYGTGDWLINFALWKGGDEKNIKPGLDAIEELAKLGNIGVVYSSEADAIRAIATGEAAVGILTAGNIYELYRQGVPIDAVFIIPGVKTVVVADVIAVVNGPRKDDALKFVDFFLREKNQEEFSKAVGLPPANSKSKIDPEVMRWNLKPDEVSMVGYMPDPQYKAEKIDEWVSWWDRTIVPLLKK
jgi:putative spermidine/putrescine transport system substrate-binding protein